MSSGVSSPVVNRWRSSRSIDFSPCSRVDDRQGRAIARRRHQLPRLGLADAALLDQLPFQTLADGGDQLIDQLVRQRRPADQPVLDGAVVAVILGDAPERGDGQLRARIAGQGGDHFRFVGIREHVGQPLRQVLAPGHREGILHGVRAHDLAQIVVAEHRAALQNCARHLEIVAGKARRHAVRQVRAGRHRLGERLTHVLLEIPDQQLEHRFGQRARVALDQVVVLTAELCGERGARGGRRIALQGTHVGERKGLHASRPGAIFDQLGAAPAGPGAWRVSAR